MLKPQLRFETHFQSDGLPIPSHNSLLVAVSGGGDSIALLHLLKDWKDRSNSLSQIHVATVDHGIRPESGDEAVRVGEISRALNFKHTILKWHRPENQKPTSDAARTARYELLCDHAESLGATALLLGHTMDDQAETVLMRAKRGGATRGLSGMTQWSKYASPTWRIGLFRPLLLARREVLRTYLQEIGATWIDDPSNDDPASERVRVRQHLAQDSATPGIENIARLASLSARSRAWLSRQSADFIADLAVEVKDGEFELAELPTKYQSARVIIAEAFAALVMASGGKERRVPTDKFGALIEAYIQGRPHRMALGRALVSVRRGKVCFQREQRAMSAKPVANGQAVLWDGRFLVRPSGENGVVERFIIGMERFLPATDFPVARTLKTLVRST